MFERFTADARAADVGAQAHARRLAQRPVGTAHLLRAMVDIEGPTSTALAATGITAATLDVDLAADDVDAGAADRCALASIGIDLDAVLAAIGPDLAAAPPPIGRFGVGLRRRLRRAWSRPDRRSPRPAPWASGSHIPFSPRAKRCLELALREALRLGSRRITTEHVLLGILREGQGQACRILTHRGASITALRRDLEGQLRRTA